LRGSSLDFKFRRQQVIDGFIVQQVADSVWAIDEFGIDLMYLIIGTEKAMLLDTGIGLGKVSDVVKKMTDLPLIVVNSHHHYDHAGGNAQFKRVYAHKKAIKTIQEQNSLQMRKSFFESQKNRREYSGCPTYDEDIKRIGTFELVPIEEGYIFDLGDIQLETIFTPGHTEDAICLLDRKNKILFSADTLVSTPTLVFDYYSPTLSVYQKSLQKLWNLKDQFELIFPGHYLKPIGKVYLRDMIQCVEDIQSRKAVGKHREMGANEREGLYYRYGHASIIYNEDRIDKEKACL